MSVECSENCPMFEKCENKNSNNFEFAYKNKYGYCEFIVKSQMTGGGGEGGGRKPNFITLNKVKYFKGELLSKVIAKLNSGEYTLDKKNPDGTAYFSGWNKRYCEHCKCEEWHCETECLVCGDINKIENNNFIVKNNIKYFKNEPIEEVVRKLDSGEYTLDKLNENGTKYFSGWDYRFGHWCYNGEDVLTGKMYKLNGNNFYTVDAVEFVFDFSIEQYVESSKFFKKHQERIENLDSNEFIDKFINEEGFKKEAIVVTGENSWNRSMTDKYLVDKNYGWICYIKMFQNKPFIVGKTGTTLVSKSYIDFNFIVGDRENPNYAGPGREYIRRYYPDIEFTDFEYVLVRGFGTEQEALEFEDYIARKYQLFQS